MTRWYVGWVSLLCAGALAACSDPDPPTQNPPTTQDMAEDTSPDLVMMPDVGPDLTPDMNDDDMSSDMSEDMPQDMPEDMPEDMSSWPTTPIGVLNVTLWAADAQYPDPELHAHAVFSPALAELEIFDPTGWLASTRGWDVYVGDDYWVIPALGASVDATLPPAGPDALDLRDAGEFVVLGEDAVARLNEDLVESDPAARVYATLLEDAAQYALMEDLSAPLAIEIEGGADVDGRIFAQDFEMPPAWQLTSHDPLQILPVREGADIVFTWVPTPEDDEVLLVVERFDDVTVWNVEDDGDVNVNELLAARGQELGPPEELSFSLMRVVTRELRTPQGILTTRATRKLYFYPRAAGPYAIEPDVWTAAATTPVRATWNDGTFDPANLPTIDVGPGVTISNLRIVDAANHILEFDAELAPGTTLGRRDLVISQGGQELLRLKKHIWLAEPLPVQGVCLDALDEGVVSDGAYIASDGGLERDGYFSDVCWEGDPDGREQAIPLTMTRGQRLKASLRNPTVPGALYIAKSCDDIDDVEACTTSPARRRTADLTYQSYRDEQILLVVDSYGGGTLDPTEYLVDIERSQPYAFGVDPTYIPANFQSTLQIVSFQGDFDANATFDFGPDVTVLTSQIFGNFAEVEVLASNNITDPTPDISVGIQGATQTLPDALYVARDIDGPASCQAADAQGPLTSGSYEGLTFGGGSGVVSVQPCKSDEAEGKEAIFRIELGPSETLRARASMEQSDAVLYLVRDCAGEALVCSDNSVDGGGEYIEWTGPATPSVVYLVVDGFTTFDEDLFYLDIDISL